MQSLLLSYYFRNDARSLNDVEKLHNIRHHSPSNNQIPTANHDQ